MPRKKICQHPTRHLASLSPPTAQRLVFSRLNKFMHDRYDLDDTKVTGLCAKCYAFEQQQMIEDEAMDIEEQTNSDTDVFNDDEENEVEQGRSDIADDNDEESDDVCNEKESDDDESFYELTYQQEKAMKTLSSVFQILDVGPIHDR